LIAIIIFTFIDFFIYVLLRVSPLLSHRLGLVNFVNEAILGPCVRN